MASTQKTGLTGGLSRAQYTPVGRGVRRPLRKKIEFGIGGDAISHCLDGRTCSLLIRSSITFSVLEPLILTIFMQIWTNHRTHIFKKWGVSTPRPSVAPPVTVTMLYVSVVVGIDAELRRSYQSTTSFSVKTES